MSQIEEAAVQAAEIPTATAPTPAAGVSPRMSWVILRRLVLCTITWVCVVGLILIWVTGCTQRNVELPDNSGEGRSEEHTSELQSLMRISYAVFCLKKKNPTKKIMT